MLPVYTTYRPSTTHVSTPHPSYVNLYHPSRSSLHSTMDNMAVNTGYLLAPPMSPISHQQNHPFAFPGFSQQPLPVNQGLFRLTSPSSPYYPLYRSISFPPLEIHPYLQVKFPRTDLIFDFSQPTFSPIKCMSPGKFVMHAPEELNQLATHPPITRLRIRCDLIRRWPVDLNYNVPITVYDIMTTIWQYLHVGISNLDWAKLIKAKQWQAWEAYRKRCRFAASQRMMVSNEGMRRVDFLLSNVQFKGLTLRNDNIDRSYVQMWLAVAEA